MEMNNTPRTLKDEIKAEFDRLNFALAAANARVEKLERENKALEEGLRHSFCPFPLNDDRTVNACLATGKCGCENLVLLGAAMKEGK
jgi:hypothetical protein